MRWVWDNVDKQDWHRWYAWHPVKLKDTSEWCWLEEIERKDIGDSYYSDRDWIYRLTHVRL